MCELMLLLLLLQTMVATLVGNVVTTIAAAHNGRMDDPPPPQPLLLFISYDVADGLNSNYSGVVCKIYTLFLRSVGFFYVIVFSFHFTWQNVPPVRTISLYLGHLLRFSDEA